MKITEREAQALAALNGDRNFEVILEALRDAERDYYQQFVNERDRDEILRLQGRASEVSSLIENAVNAQKIVKRYRQKQGY